MIQLVYMSAATRKFDIFELNELLAKARQNNHRLNISGMLVYHDDSFLQVLEGDDQAVDAVYNRISQDCRHTKCELLLRMSIDRKSFGDWKMGFVNTTLSPQKSWKGFSNIFEIGFSREKFVAEPSAARKLLLAFRDGQWRQKVETVSPFEVASSS